MEVSLIVPLYRISFSFLLLLRIYILFFQVFGGSLFLVSTCVFIFLLKGELLAVVLTEALTFPCVVGFSSSFPVKFYFLPRAALQK